MAAIFIGTNLLRITAVMFPPITPTQNFAEFAVVKLTASGGISLAKNLWRKRHRRRSGVRNTADGGYIFTADVASIDGDLTEL